MVMEAIVLDSKYAFLTEDNKRIVDSFIEFLIYKQERQEENILTAIKEYEDGDAAGPFASVDDLMADLYA